MPRIARSEESCVRESGYEEIDAGSRVVRTREVAARIIPMAMRIVERARGDEREWLWWARSLLGMRIITLSRPTMNTNNGSTRLVALLGVALLIGGVFALIVRPWYLRWGATDLEVAKPLAGDEIVAGSTGTTRAITVHAPVERVWPWLAQIGQDRGGFYSFDLLENIVGCEMPTVDCLRPDRQTWVVGDKLWMYPSNKAGGGGFATLRSYVPGRALGFGTHMTNSAPDANEDGSWSFVVEPIDDSTTRLLIRGRGAPGRSLLGVMFDRSIFEPVHFVMERRMMIGVGQLAEGVDRGRVLNHLHAVLWLVTFMLVITSLVLTFRRHNWRRSVVAFAVSCAVFQYLTFAQPHVVIGGILVSGLAVLVLGGGDTRKQVTDQRARSAVNISTTE